MYGHFEIVPENGNMLWEVAIRPVRGFWVVGDCTGTSVIEVIVIVRSRTEAKDKSDCPGIASCTDLTPCVLHDLQ